MVTFIFFFLPLFFLRRKDQIVVLFYCSRALLSNVCKFLLKIKKPRFQNSPSQSLVSSYIWGYEVSFDFNTICRLKKIVRKPRSPW